MKTKQTTTPPLRNSLSPAAAGRGFFLLIALALALAWLALSPTAQAVSPPPDGGYLSGNTAEGDSALFSLTSGTYNTAMGFHALFSNTTGDYNTANGSGALQSNTTGGANTANGYQALFNNTTGGGNTANGLQALSNNTTGFNNTATGVGALTLNTDAFNNTATGTSALLNNTEGDNNTATGAAALQNNSTGTQNTATGVGALYSNTTGNFNTAGGDSALLNNTTGNNNTAEGFQALENSTGSNNIALGSNAGINLTSGNNNIDIAAPGVAGESKTIRIGTVGVHKRAYMQGISGATVASGVAVIVDSNGHLGTVQSSARFKDEIKPMDKASEAILALKPVTFRYKKELDPEGIPQFGLVAEEVAKVNADLVVRDENGEIYTVRYEAVNAMLLNEFLKEHRKVQELEMNAGQQQKHFESALAKQETTIDKQQKQIEALTATVQKVSDQIALSKPAPQLVANP